MKKNILILAILGGFITFNSNYFLSNSVSQSNIMTLESISSIAMAQSESSGDDCTANVCKSAPNKSCLCHNDELGQEIWQDYDEYDPPV
jgi:hypothetical protein